MNILLKYTIALTILFFTGSMAVGQKMSRPEYIEKYKELAVKQMQASGIPASIILAQACLESGDGNSRLATEGKNHFGIKCHTWEGPKIYHDDDANGECFRKYGNAEESFKDHSDFLRFRDRYRFLFELKTNDYKGWAQGLKKAGYATNPNYPQMLIKIIEEYNLSQYDNLALNIPPTPMEIEAPKEANPIISSELYKFTLDRELLEKNGVAYIVGSKNDTYSTLARDYKLFTRELLRFNDLKKEQPIEEGTIIYVEKKKKKAEPLLEKHITDAGDTMYELSQRYAIQLKYLYKMNNMKSGSEPEAGQIIKLR
jgi:LysM repeat protein